MRTWVKGLYGEVHKFVRRAIQTESSATGNCNKTIPMTCYLLDDSPR